MSGYVVFEGERRLAAGPKLDVAVAAHAQGEPDAVLAGRQVGRAADPDLAGRRAANGVDPRLDPAVLVVAHQGAPVVRLFHEQLFIRVFYEVNIIRVY